MVKKVSAELSIKLGKYFGVSDDIFFNIQKDVDMRKAKRMNQKRFNKIKPFPRKK